MLKWTEENSLKGHENERKTATELVVLVVATCILVQLERRYEVKNSGKLASRKYKRISNVSLIIVDINLCCKTNAKKRNKVSNNEFIE